MGGGGDDSSRAQARARGYIWERLIPRPIINISLVESDIWNPTVVVIHS